MRSMRAMKAVLSGLVVAALATPSAMASGPLVPGELRLGPTPDAPLLADHPSPLIRDAETRPLTSLRYEAANGATVTCSTARPPVIQGFSVFPGDVYHGVFGNGSEDCAAVGLSGVTSPVASWEGFVRARYEQGNHGAERNGALEIIRGPFNGRFSFILFTTFGPCEYQFLPGTRFDWFNPGDGHKIVLDHEPLSRVRRLSGQHYAACPGDDDPTTIDARVSQQVRLRAWDTATRSYSLPVWLHPQAQ
jgi:hypothetical protein